MQETQLEHPFSTPIGGVTIDNRIARQAATCLSDAAMHKLTNVEAQRVMAVLGETLDRLDYLSYVTTDVDHGLVEQLEEEGCSDVANILQRQWQNEEANAMSNGTNTNEICANTRALCRALRTNPVAVETVYRSSKQHRSSSFLACVKALKELTDVTLRKMSTTVEDASSQTNLLHDVTEREKGAEEDRATLQAQLNMERKEKERDIAPTGYETYEIDERTPRNHGKHQDPGERNRAGTKRADG